MASLLVAVAVCFAGTQESTSLRKRFTNQDVIELTKVRVGW